MSEFSLYLALASPRRRALVQSLGLPVTAGVSPVDEDALQQAYTGPNDGLGEYLARQKALSAAQLLAHQGPPANLFVLGADTTVLLDGRVLGKPADTTEATHMLRSLRGRQHTVVTGIALARPAAPGMAPELRSAHVATHVIMRPYGDDEIAAYVATGDPLDKAGAYGVQHDSFQPVARIEGCYTAVVGLPLCAVASLISAVTGLPVLPRTPSTPCPWSTGCRAPLPPFAQARAAR